MGARLLGGAYAGFDFLLNAALLLAAYLFAVRFAVRRGLAWRARRLLGEVILRTRQALGAPGRRRPHRRAPCRGGADAAALPGSPPSKRPGAPISAMGCERATT